MFDSKEIAQNALVRAEEMRQKRNRALNYVKAASVFAGVGVAAALFVTVGFPGGGFWNRNTVDFDDGQIPLGAYGDEDDARKLPGGETETDENAVPYAGAAINDGADSDNSSGFFIPYYDNVKAASDSGIISMLLVNPEGNRFNFIFEIILAETSETLYKSGLVAPGMCLEKFTAALPLPKGEHKAFLYIRSYEPDGNIEVSGVRADFTLNVE